MGASRKKGGHHAREALRERETGTFPIPLDEPTVLSLQERVHSGTLVQYVLPLQWSLYHALTDKQWQELRESHKELYPDWDRCSCPKHCKTDTLDEHWRYERATHTKVFVDAAFICRGCHWLKSLTWRTDTWIKQQSGRLPVTSKPPHIIDCLGWTQAQVDALRERDLKRHRAESIQLTQLEQQIQVGKAAIAPSPIERLPPQDLAAIAKPGQVVVVPWRVDLSALAGYGYSNSQIAEFEQRMYQLAARQMTIGATQLTFQGLRRLEG
jgi:hypothetical protein